MKTMKRNGFTTVEIIIAVAVVIAVLCATLIPTFVNISNNNKAQEQTQKDLEQLAQQLADKKNPLTLEEIEAKIAEAIAGIKLPEGVSADDVNKAITDAIAGIELPEEGLTSEQVQAIIDSAIANLDNLTQEDIEKIVSDAIAGIELPEEGLSAEEIKAIVDEALKGLDTGITSEEVQEIVDAAIKNLKLPEAGITAEQAEKIIAEALSKIDTGLSAAEVEKIINDALANLETGLTAAEVEKLIADALAKLEIPEAGLSAEEVSKLIADAIAGIEFPETLDKATVEKLIADAIAGIEFPESGLTAEEVEKLIADALAKLEIPAAGLTAEEVKKIVADALAELQIPEAGPSVAEIEAMINKALANLKPGVTAEELKAAIDAAMDEILATIEGNYLTKDQVKELIEKALEGLAPVAPTTVKVENAADFASAIADPDIKKVIFEANVTLTEALTVEKDLTIDLNGNKLYSPSKTTYPESLMFDVAADSTVTVKGGALVDRSGNLNGGWDFFRVGENAVLNLDDVTMTITVTPEVFYNNTMNRWQTNSATHRIFVIDSNATVNLTNSDIAIVSNKFANVSTYVRQNITIVGVHFARNSTNAKFVMDGGSFTMEVTDPNVNGDNLYFVKSEREINTLANASNIVDIKGDAQIAIGAPNENGELKTTNNLFYLGAGYYNGKTYYSGIKSFMIGSEADIDLNGVCYSMNKAYEWALEGFCQELGSSFANKRFDNITEIVYHFECSNYGYSCTYEADLTLGEVTSKCPVCGKGTLILK